jgi:hypothetical protein
MAITKAPLCATFFCNLVKVLFGSLQFTRVPANIPPVSISRSGEQRLTLRGF